MTTAGARIDIVPARREHVPFIAWVMLAASRSHLERSFWDRYTEQPEAETLRFLEALASTPAEHFAHYTGFLVAEVDGVPAAALSGYFEAERGQAPLGQGMMEANQAMGVPQAEVQARGARLSSVMNVLSEHVERAWIVEWVATRPEFRRRGLVDRLLGEVLGAGRQRGAPVADISVLIGNDPAQLAYEKAGFTAVGEKRDAAFEADYGSPGMRLLRRPL